MQAIPVGHRTLFEDNAQFKDEVKAIIGNIVEYSQAPLRYRNICRHGYQCSGHCVTASNFKAT
jgi:hypothetical protein